MLLSSTLSSCACAASNTLLLHAQISPLFGAVLAHGVVPVPMLVTEAVVKEEMVPTTVLLLPTDDV